MFQTNDLMPDDRSGSLGATLDYANAQRRFQLRIVKDDAMRISQVHQ